MLDRRILLALGFCLAFILLIQPAKAWTMDDRDYYKNITITNTTSMPRDYPVYFRFNCSGNCNADGSDIFVVNRTNSTINFGLDILGADDFNISIRVNMTSSSYYNVSIFYGAAGASASNDSFQDVYYAFWHDFENGLYLDKFTESNNLAGTSYSVINGRLCVEDTNLNTNWNTKAGLYATGLTAFDDYWLIKAMNLSWDNQGVNDKHAIWGVGVFNSTQNAYDDATSAIGIADKSAANANVELWSEIKGVRTESGIRNQDDEAEVTINKTGGNTYHDWTDAVGTYQNNGATWGSDNLWVIYNGHSSENYASWYLCLDAIYYRRFKEPEPASGTLGAEQAASGMLPTNVTLYLNNSNGNQTLTYGDISNITGRVDIVGLNVVLYRNGTLINNQTTQAENITDINWFVNATYNITAYTAGNASYNPSSDTLYIFVNRALTTINVSINGTQANQTYGYCSYSNATAWKNVANGAVSLLRNGSAVSNPDVSHLARGTYNYTANFSHQNYSASPVTRWLNVTYGDSDLTLSANPSWNVAENQEVTITCSAIAALSITLYRDGVNVTSPYTTTLPFGNYNFTCIISDTQNYTPSSSTHYLNVLTGGFGCTNTSTYAFGLTVSASTNYTTYNFTELVLSSYVKPDLSDVHFFGINFTRYKNQTGNNYYFILNTTNETSDATLRFGNYIGNITHTNTTNSTGQIFNIVGVTGYSEINPYYVLTFLDEVEGNQLLPPAANNTITLFCSGGASTFNLTDTRILVASFQILEEIKASVAYSSTEIYYRNRLVTGSVEHKNIYMVDANEHQVVQMLFKLYDSTGNFDNSIFRIKKYLEGSLETITELRFDTEDKAIVYLINGDRYQIFIDSGTEERNIGYLYVDTTDLEKNIILGQITTTNTTHANITFSLTYNQSMISFSWLDPSSNTTRIDFWVWNFTNTSQQLYYSYSTNHSRVNFNYVVPDVNETYLVEYKIAHALFGEEITHVKMALISPLAMFPAVLFPLILAVEAIGGNAAVWVTLLMVLPIPMIFDKKNAGLAGIVMVALATLFSYWFGYPVVGLALTIGLFIAVYIEIKNRRKYGD